VSRRRNKTQPAVTCFWNKIEYERFTKRAGEPERLLASNLGRCRSSQDRIAAEAVSGPSIGGREPVEIFGGRVGSGSLWVFYTNGMVPLAGLEPARM
jgi:hypothetical protein